MSIVKVQNAGQIGFAPDMPAFELPPNAWTRVRNVAFRDGCAERSRGTVTIFDTPSVTPYYIVPYQVGDKRYWLHAGLASVFADDGSTRTDITGTAPTGAATDYWNGGSLSGIAVLNNGKDQPMFWGGDTALNLATLTGWNANWRAKVVRPFKQYLVALDITKSGTRYGNMVKWSHAAVPGSLPSSWDETDVTKDAGEQDLADEPSNIVDCLPLGDVNIIYKERAMYAMQYIGAPFVFKFQRLPGDVGMLAQRCAVNTPIGNIVLTAGDVIVHNMQGPQSIANGQVRKWLFTNMDSDNYRNSFLVANPNRNEVWICFPLVGSTFCNQALIYNWLDKSWSLRELTNVTHGDSGQITYTQTNTWASSPKTWATAADSWNNNDFAQNDARLILCSTKPSIDLVGSGLDFSGTSFTSVLERTGMNLGDDTTVKTVRSVFPRFDAATGTQIKVEIGASMDAETQPTWSSPVTHTVGQTFKVDSFATGRFISIRFTSLDEQRWRLKGFDFDVIISGAY